MPTGVVCWNLRWLILQRACRWTHVSLSAQPRNAPEKPGIFERAFCISVLACGSINFLQQYFVSQLLCQR
ncbi:hypothetical protein GJAV_G00173810 [Gymnothorax javanicus]|nr:hypothetical protein GJAV_G00173810 [Gymnothorax javanicus]